MSKAFFVLGGFFAGRPTSILDISFCCDVGKAGLS